MITLYLLAVPAYMFRGRDGRAGESAQRVIQQSVQELKKVVQAFFLNSYWGDLLGSYYDFPRGCGLVNCRVVECAGRGEGYCIGLTVGDRNGAHTTKVLPGLDVDCYDTVGFVGIVVLPYDLATNRDVYGCPGSYGHIMIERDCDGLLGDVRTNA